MKALFREMGESCRTFVQGRDDVIALVLTALSDGHVLLEDHPGSGKTTLAKALGDTIVDDRPDDEIVTFRRIQFTPDLLPSDVTGEQLFDPERALHLPARARLRQRRAGRRNQPHQPKVQAALLEAMAEKQVTVDNETHRLEAFVVINPLDLAGTYPLPRAQLDRFLFKIKMKHLSRESELAVLDKWKGAALPCKSEWSRLPCCSRPVIWPWRRSRSLREFTNAWSIWPWRCNTIAAFAWELRLAALLVQAIPALPILGRSSTVAITSRRRMSNRSRFRCFVIAWNWRPRTDAEEIVTECVDAVVEEQTSRTLSR